MQYNVIPLSIALCAFNRSWIVTKYGYIILLHLIFLCYPFATLPELREVVSKASLLRFGIENLLLVCLKVRKLGEPDSNIIWTRQSKDYNLTNTVGLCICDADSFYPASWIRCLDHHEYCAVLPYVLNTVTVQGCHVGSDGWGRIFSFHTSSQWRDYIYHMKKYLLITFVHCLYFFSRNRTIVTNIGCYFVLKSNMSMSLFMFEFLD